VAVLRHGPDETRVLPEIVGQERLAGTQRILYFVDIWRLRIDQIGIGGETPFDFLLRGLAIGTQLLDRGGGRAHRLIVALIRRQSQQIVDLAERGADLLAEILLVAHELGERRVLRYHARARIGERLLHRAAADGIGKPECLDGDVVRLRRIAGEHGDIGLDCALQPRAPRRDNGRIVARPRGYRDGGLEFADRVGVAAGPRIATGERTARRRGIEAVGAGAAHLLLDQRRGGGDSGVDLPGCVERGNARAVQFEYFTLLRRPLRRGLVELRVIFACLLHLPLQHENVAEARKNRRAQRRFIGNADRALHLKRRTAKLLGFLVTPLLNQDPGQPDNESRGGRRV